MTKSEKLGVKLQHRRKVLNLTRPQAAERIGISDGLLLFIEDGRGASPEVLRRVAKAYELDVVDLMIQAGHLTRGDLAKHQERRAAA